MAPLTMVSFADCRALFMKRTKIGGVERLLRRHEPHRNLKFAATARNCCVSNSCNCKRPVCPHCVSSNGVQRMAAVALVQDQEELAV